MVSMENNEKIISKIQKLMALGESPNEAEAAAAAEKAQKLMIENGIAAADLADHDASKIEVGTADTTVGSGLWRGWLAYAIADTAGGKSIQFKQRGTHSKTIRFYGPGDTAEQMRDTFEIMQRALDTISKIETTLHKPPHEHGRTFRSSFLVAATCRIIDRLNERREVVVEETNDPQALVLVSTAVDRVFTEAHPNTTTSTSKSAVRSAAGEARGRATGNSFNLGDRTLAKGRGQLSA